MWILLKHLIYRNIEIISFNINQKVSKLKSDSAVNFQDSLLYTNKCFISGNHLINPNEKKNTCLFIPHGTP